MLLDKTKFKGTVGAEEDWSITQKESEWKNGMKYNSTKTKVLHLENEREGKEAECIGESQDNNKPATWHSHGKAKCILCNRWSFLVHVKQHSICFSKCYGNKELQPFICVQSLRLAVIFIALIWPNQICLSNVWWIFTPTSW